MTQQEKQTVKDFHRHCMTYLFGEFSCKKCKKLIKPSDCIGCPIKNS